jgi:hypothetical protein
MPEASKAVGRTGEQAHLDRGNRRADFVNCYGTFTVQPDRQLVGAEPATRMQSSEPVGLTLGRSRCRIRVRRESVGMWVVRMIGNK